MQKKYSTLGLNEKEIEYRVYQRKYYELNKCGKIQQLKDLDDSQASSFENSSNSRESGESSS